MKKTINLETREVVFTFDDESLAPLTVAYDALDPGIQVHAALHGIAQKVGDAAANGKTEADRRAMIAPVVDHILSAGPDEWNRKPTGDGTSGTGLLCLALIEVLGVDRATAQSHISGMDKKVQAALRADEEIAPVIARIKAERAANARPKTPSADAVTHARHLLSALRAQVA